MPVPKMDPWSVQDSKQKSTDEKNELPYRGAIFSTIVAPSADEEVVVDSAVGRRKMSFAYAFASANAWMRGQPEATTTMLSIIGGDSKDLQPISYFDKQKSVAARSYIAASEQIRANPSAAIPQILPYRPLNPGELDFGSRFAHLFLGQKDVFQARGGLSHQTLSSMEAKTETPLWKVEGPAHQASTQLNDEVRFGVVRRATPDRNSTFPALVRGPGPSQRNPAASPFAKEATMVLNWQGLPTTLLDHRQGIVVENDGTLARSLSTNQRLRARFRWKTTASETVAEIDESGNWSLTAAYSATTGGQMSIPTGSFQLAAGQTVTARAGLDMNLEATKNWNGSGLTGFTLSSPARGTVRGLSGVAVQSNGVVTIESPVPSGVQLGMPGTVKHPVLLGAPQFLSTLSTAWSSQASAEGTTATYAAAAAQAWAAIGPLMMVLDPSGTVASLCLAAASAAVPMALAASAASTAIGAHLPTLTTAPLGFVSTKTISE